MCRPMLHMCAGSKTSFDRLPKVLVIDIGGFTVDYMILRYGRLEKEHVDSLESGVICLYGRNSGCYTPKIQHCT